MDCINTPHLPNLALGEELLDLSSWLFQDDGDQQDFHQVAKGVHSPSSMKAGSASPSIISPDYPDWVESLDINWDQPFILEDSFEDSKKHAQQECLQSPKSLTSDFNDVFADQMVSQGVKTEERLQQNLKFEEKADVSQILYQQAEVASPPRPFNSLDVGYQEYNFSPPHQFDDGEILATDAIDGGPYIFSVPISDAVNKKKGLKKINITSIQVLGSPTHAFSQFNNHYVYQESSTPYQPQNSQKIINVKAVSLSSKFNIKPEFVEVLPEPPRKTLKDMIASDDADDLIRELVSHSSSVQDREETTTVTISSSDLDDQSYGGYSPASDTEENANIHSDFMHSPASTSSYSCSDERADSPELIISEEFYESKPNSRSSPYSTVERKLRKKEQNKRAALRYRQKKKDEEESIMTVFQREEEKQKVLKERYATLQMEVKLMKKLMVEVLIKKMRK